MVTEIEKVICKTCNVSDYREEEKNLHIGLYCNLCNGWIKWQQQEVKQKLNNTWEDWEFPNFGKYANVKMKLLPEFYLKWAINNIKDHKLVEKLKIVYKNNFNKQIVKKELVKPEDIYQVKDLTGKVILEGSLNDIRINISDYIDGYSMIYPGYIMQSGKLVATLEFLRKT